MITVCALAGGETIGEGFSIGPAWWLGPLSSVSFGDDLLVVPSIKLGIARANHAGAFDRAACSGQRLRDVRLRLLHRDQWGRRARDRRVGSWCRRCQWRWCRRRECRRLPSPSSILVLEVGVHEHLRQVCSRNVVVVTWCRGRKRRCSRPRHRLHSWRGSRT